MIKVVLFDADGVLIKGGMFSEVLARDFGISMEMTKSFFTGAFRECLVGKADLKVVIEPYLKEWGWEDGVDKFLDYWFKSEHKVDEDLVDYIQGLREKGIKCYLATNQEKYRAEYILKEMEFSVSLDKVFVSANLGVMKPEVEFYSKVLEDLGITEPGEVLYWDDAKENVEAAEEVGIKAEVYTNFEDFKKKMANYLDTELKKII